MKNVQLTIDFSTENKEVPIYQQIVESISLKIASGILKPGTPIPSTRKLAEQLQVSRKTIVTAMEILQTKGKLVSRDRVGLFVAQEVSRHNAAQYYNTPKIEKRDGGTAFTLVIDDGYPDTQLLPFREFSRSYRKLFNRAALWHKLGYNNPMGYPKLREYIVNILGHSREIPIENEELCIVRGAQMALFLVANAILEPSDHIAVESPGYYRAYETFRKAGLNVHEIPVDNEGIISERLEELCHEVDLKAVYLTPRHQYPTTVKLSSKRRKHISNISREYDVVIIEDDFGAEFQFTGKHLLPLSAIIDKGHYIYIGTFSKIFAPAIRVGYIVSSIDRIQKIVNYRSLIDIQGDTIAERALCELYEYNDMQRHIKKTARIYRERLEFISKEINQIQNNRIIYKKPHGGLAIWLKLDVTSNANNLKKVFANRGIDIPIFKLSDSSIGLRIGYASLSFEQMSELVHSISAIVDSLPNC